MQSVARRSQVGNGERAVHIRQGRASAWLAACRRYDADSAPRSSSLMEVLARVCASTRLTITAQYRL